MTREELEEAYGRLQEAIGVAVDTCSSKIELDLADARILDHYIFDPEYAFDDGPDE